jgi:hypothetical protein
MTICALPIENNAPAVPIVKMMAFVFITALWLVLNVLAQSACLRPNRTHEIARQRFAGEFKLDHLRPGHPTTKRTSPQNANRPKLFSIEISAETGCASGGLWFRAITFLSPSEHEPSGIAL